MDSLATLTEQAELARDDPAPGQGERVLLIDDEDALIYLLSRALKNLGYAVSGFSDPDQALAAFRSRPGSFDVAVTDVSMPEMSGFDLAGEMLAVRPDLPIVVTTGCVRPEDQDQAAQLGIRELILKPDTFQEMGSTLDRLFRGLRKPPR